MDASPLILLTKAGHLDLLRAGGMVVVVPDVVVAEVGAKGAHDPTARAIEQAGWLSVEPAPEMPEPVRGCNLDPGESAVLALALGDHASEVVLDDLAGRRCARGSASGAWARSASSSSRSGSGRSRSPGP